MNHVLTGGSLFSGIGGLDLGLEWAGIRTIWQAETNGYAARVLRKNFPGVPNLWDVSRVDWSRVERPDVVFGGFPCQPVSQAGLRQGQEDTRWLWPEFKRCLAELRPQFAIMENVPGLLSQGFGDVIGDLAELGYAAEWGRIPAAAVGAPHLRWRVFIVACLEESSSAVSDADDRRVRVERKRRGEQHSEPGTAILGADGSTWFLADADFISHWRLSGRLDDEGEVAEPPGPSEALPDSAREGCARGSLGLDGAPDYSSAERSGENVADSSSRRRYGIPGEQGQGSAGGGRPREGSQDVADAEGLAEWAGLRQGDEGRQWERRSGDGSDADASDADSEGPQVGIRNDSSSWAAARSAPRGNWWATEPDVGRVANGIPSRVDRLTGLGNAVVPMVGYVVGRIVVAWWERIQAA